MTSRVEGRPLGAGSGDVQSAWGRAAACVGKCLCCTTAKCSHAVEQGTQAVVVAPPGSNMQG